MTKIGFIFPGQGSQKVGMGKDLVDAYPQYLDKYRLANDVLGVDLMQTSFDGPKDVLTQTQFAQPAIFMVSVILSEILAMNGVVPSCVAGHSLGELTAYHVAGVYNLHDGLSLIKERGNSMADASPGGTGMSAVIGLDASTISEIILPFINRPLVIANYNCPGQIVISGDKAALEEVNGAIKSKGGKVIPLPVSGAFHSPLMQPASEILKKSIHNYIFESPKCPVILNRTGESAQEGEALKENIPLQVVSSVRWMECIAEMERCVDIIFEVGPGSVLTGLNKKMDVSIPYYSISSVETLNNCLEEIKGVV